MAKIRNKKTKVEKEIEKEFIVSMYLGTGEWELVEEKTISKTPIIDTSSTKEEK